MADRIEMVEVSPRDGLQNEAVLLSTSDKLELIERAVAAGLRRVETTSFVNPRKVPQMADAEEVSRQSGRFRDASFSVLALNLRGVARAIAAGTREINYVFVASDTFSARNNGAPTFETLRAWPEVHDVARQHGLRLAVVISAAFGCPFEGEVSQRRVLDIAESLGGRWPDELALADTIGVAVPRQVTSLFKAVGGVVDPSVALRAHFHDTRNTAIANAVAAYEVGVRVIDGALGGIGGCPFAPAAAGNVATEDLVYCFERMGVSTGVNLDAAIVAAHWILEKLGKQGMGAVARAGGFPTGALAAPCAA